MAIYKRINTSIPANQSPIANDWNKMMAELFYPEKRSVSNSTPDSSSGVVSDEHYLTISEHSESFSSPRRGPKPKPPLTFGRTRPPIIRQGTTPSPTRHVHSSVSYDFSPCNPPPPSPPTYPNMADLKLSSDPRSGFVKKQMKAPKFPFTQNKFSPAARQSDGDATAKPPKSKKSTFPDLRRKLDPAKCAYFDSLEDHVITRIFQNLPSNELCKCAMVSKRWYQLVWNPCLWSHVVIDSRALDVDRGLKCLTTALSCDDSKICLIIESIDLCGCVKLTDRGLYTVATRCPELKELLLDGCQEITNIAIFEIVSRCTNLESLSLSGCQYVNCISLTPEANLQAATYGKQVYLSHLDMTDCLNVDDSSLQMIVTYCSRLNYLYLRRCVKITDVGVQYAASYCSKLQELSVSDCPNISDLGMRDISRLESNLRYLSIAKCRRISDVGLKCVTRRCVKLRYLNVRGCDKITEDGISYLAAYCSKLRSLDLGSCNSAVSDRALQALADGCDQLRRLSLKGCSLFTDAGVLQLAARCRQLQQLNVIDCRISSKTFIALHKHCPSCIVEHNNLSFR